MTLQDYLDAVARYHSDFMTTGHVGDQVCHATLDGWVKDALVGIPENERPRNLVGDIHEALTRTQALGARLVALALEDGAPPPRLALLMESMTTARHAQLTLDRFVSLSARLIRKEGQTDGERTKRTDKPGPTDPH